MSRNETSVSASFAAIGGLVGELANALHRIEEQRARAALLGWLPRGLKWLADHPRLLRGYLRLPHRTEIVAVVERGTFKPATYLVQPKRRRIING